MVREALEDAIPLLVGGTVSVKLLNKLNDESRFDNKRTFKKLNLPKLKSIRRNKLL